MSASSLLEILKIRLYVGFLGEKAQFGWWPTAFYAASSKMFLEPVFSKSSRLAQYHGILEAARRLHDEHLSVGIYHLFRLPEETEQDLHKFIQRSEESEFLLRETLSKESVLGGLKDLAGTFTTTSFGPAVIGNISELNSHKTAKVFAASYLSAFSQDAKAYPYLIASS